MIEMIKSPRLSRAKTGRLLHNAATQGSDDMAKVTGLKNRNGHWTLRVRVPDAVRPAIGKLEISKSFGAVSFAEASRLARIERVAIDQQFHDATVSLMRARNAVPSDEDIRFLARSIFHQLEAGSSAVPLHPSDRDRAEEQNSEDHRMISGDVDDAGLQLVAMAAAEHAKFHVPPGTEERSKTVHAVQRAYAEHYSRQGDRLALQSAKPQDEMFLDISAQVPPVSRLTMSKAVELYKAAPERSKISEKTRASDKFRFAALIDIIGKDRLIADDVHP